MKKIYVSIHYLESDFSIKKKLLFVLGLFIFKFFKTVMSITVVM
jgi:hypothetical protein